MAYVNPLNVLSYNLHFHQAYKEVFDIAKAQDSDIVCLQECYSDQLLQNVDGYSLACKTKSEGLGLAIYYKVGRIEFVRSSGHALRKSLYENVFKWDNERALVAMVYDLQAQKNITIVSLHATHLVATNSLRRRQMSEVFRLFEYENTPVVIAGDYNYPLFHSRLKAFIEEKEYELHIPKIATFGSIKYKGKFDFISTKRISRTRLIVLPRSESDHSPIHASIEY